MATFLPKPAKNELYHRFLGMIFFGGVGSMLALGTQWLATQEIPKNRKKAKKSVKYFSSDPCFSAKEGRFLETKFVSCFSCAGYT
jgi:hypothetical protein